MITADVPCPRCGEKVTIQFDVELGHGEQRDGMLNVRVSPILGDAAALAIAEHTATAGCL